MKLQTFEEKYININTKLDKCATECACYFMKSFILGTGRKENNLEKNMLFRLRSNAGLVAQENKSLSYLYPPSFSLKDDILFATQGNPHIFLPQD